MKDIAIALKDSSEVSALHAPGANIIILNPTAQHNESPHTFRLFGLTKGATK